MSTNFRDFLKENFSFDEIQQIDLEAETEAQAILRAQEMASDIITSLMEEEWNYRQDAPFPKLPASALEC